MRIGVSSRGRPYASFGLFSGFIYLMFVWPLQLCWQFAYYAMVGSWYVIKYLAIGTVWVYAQLAKGAVWAFQQGRVLYAERKARQAIEQRNA